jgi:hypothetical protein
LGPCCGSQTFYYSPEPARDGKPRAPIKKPLEQIKEIPERSKRRRNLKLSGEEKIMPKFQLPPGFSANPGKLRFTGKKLSRRWEA